MTYKGTDMNLAAKRIKQSAAGIIAGHSLCVSSVAACACSHPAQVPNGTRRLAGFRTPPTVAN